MKIALVYGGRSGEHSVSCVSATSILRAIDPNKYTVILIGIDHDGCWYRQNTPSTKELENSDFILSVNAPGSGQIAFIPGKGITINSQSIEIDAAFPILHGTFGEDGTIQGLFEMLNIPYVGSGVVGSSVGMDKHLAKELWQSAGINVVPYRVLFKHEYQQSEEHWVKKLINELGLPLFIKPANGGSSVGVHKAHDQKELYEYLADSFRYDTKILVEKNIDAIEVECSVLGNFEPDTFPPASIHPNHEYYDYDAKYCDPEGARFCLPADIPAELSIQVQELASRAFSIIEGRGLSRVDFFLEKSSNKLYINEINTMPGFTRISMFPRMCENGGINYSNLINRLIELAIQEHQRKSELIYER